MADTADTGPALPGEGGIVNPGDDQGNDNGGGGDPGIGPPITPTDPTTPTTPTDPVTPSKTSYARPETPSNTVWYRCPPVHRDNLRDAATRVVAMAAPSYTGGIQAGEHADSKQNVYNNLQTIDWAIWELLIALKLCGYSQRPQQ